MIPLERIIHNKKILVIDDTVEVRSALKNMLDIFGAQDVDAVIDGNDATQCLKNRHYDIVLADYHFKSGKDGQQILEEARYTRSLSASDTFILISGETSRDRVLGTIEYQPDGYIAKPFSIDLLKQRLTRILNTKRVLTPINRALDFEDYPTAIRLCEETIKRAPPVKPYCLQILGNVYIKKGTFDKAKEAFQEILKEHDLPWAKLGIAIAEYEDNQVDDAIKTLEQIIEDHPFYVHTYDWLEKCFLKQQRYLDAQNILESAIKISPRAILRQIELGKISRNNHALDICENAYRKAVNLSKNSCYHNVDNYFQLSDCILKNFKHKDSQQRRQCTREISNIAKNIRTYFKNEPEHVFMADLIESKALHMQGNSRESMSVLEKAEMSYEKLGEASVDNTLDLADLYFTTDKKTSMFDLLKTLKNKEVTKQQKQRISKMTTPQSQQEQQAYSSKLNDSAVKLFEAGRLEPAIETFMEALEYSEAGISVVLNTIQAILAHHKKTQKNSSYFQLCSNLFEQIEDIEEEDKRYERYIKLREQYYKYLD